MRKTVIPIIVIMLCASFALAISEPHWITAITQTPGTAAVGSPVTFSATLMNVSGRLLNCRIVGGIEGGPVLYDNTFERIVDGGTQVINFTWTVAAGEYTFYLQIDPDETTDDTNRSNNRITLTRSYGAVTLSGPMNLFFTPSGSVNYAPIPPLPGEETYINYPLTCDGAGCFDGLDVTVGLRVNGTIVDTNTHHFSTSGNLMDRFVWNAVCDATVEVVIDPVRIYSETNEADNSHTMTIPCREPDRANLRVYSGGYNPMPLAEGETVTFWYKLQNTSDPSIMAGPFHVALKQGDRVLRRNSHTGLGREAINYETMTGGTFTWTVSCGEPFSIVVDSDNEVIESNESDNVHSPTTGPVPFNECVASRLDLAVGIFQLANSTDETIEAGRRAEFIADVIAYRTNPRNVRIRCGIEGGPLLLDETFTELPVPRVDDAIRGERVRFNHKFCPVDRTWDIYCHVDPEGAHAESDETNNRKVITIRTEDSTRYSCTGVDTTPGSSAAPASPSTPPITPVIKKDKFDLGLKFQMRSISKNFVKGQNIKIDGIAAVQGTKKIIPVEVSGKIVEIVKGQRPKLVMKLLNRKIKVQPKTPTTFAWNWRPKKAGNYKVLAQFKPLNPSGDTNPANNRAQLPITLKTTLQLNTIKGKK